MFKLTDIYREKISNYEEFKGFFKIGLISVLLFVFVFLCFSSGSVFAKNDLGNISELNDSQNHSQEIVLNDLKVSISKCNVSDVKINNRKAKKITFPKLKKSVSIKDEAEKEGKLAKDYLKLEKTKYFGDADIKLIEKINVTKQRVKRTWKCNCTNKTINQTFSNNLTEKNETIEKTIEVCQTCKEYENYTEEVMREINPETFILRKDKPIYEVFDRCKKIEKLPNGKWGCSVITNLYIMGVKIK